MSAPQMKAPPAGLADGGAEDNELQGAVPEDYSTDPDVIEIVGDQQPHIPDGRYRARYLHHALKAPMGVPKLCIRFEIIEGEHTGTVLSAWRNTRNTGERSRVGAGANSKIATELRRVAQQRGIDMRPSRLTIRVLRDVDLAIRTATTGRHSLYSVVSDIEGLHSNCTPLFHSPRHDSPVGDGGRGNSDGRGNANTDLQLPTDNVQRTTDNGQRETANQERATDDGQREWLREFDVPDGQPLPSDFELPESWLELARQEGLWDVDRAARRFRDHYAATGRVMRDWRAAWCKWVAEDVDRQGPDDPFLGDT